MSTKRAPKRGAAAAVAAVNASVLAAMRDKIEAVVETDHGDIVVRPPDMNRVIDLADSLEAAGGKTNPRAGLEFIWALMRECVPGVESDGDAQMIFNLTGGKDSPVLAKCYELAGMEVEVREADAVAAREVPFDESQPDSASP